MRRRLPDQHIIPTSGECPHCKRRNCLMNGLLLIYSKVLFVPWISGCFINIFFVSGFLDFDSLL